MMSNTDHILTREELYNKVWSTPMQRLAKEFGISDVGLAKVCCKHDIPRPPRGYWAKLEFGRKPKKTPLPKKKDGEVQIVIRNQGTDSGSQKEPAEDITPYLSEVLSIIEEEKRPESKIKVDDNLEITNRLVQHTRHELRKCRPDDSDSRISIHNKDCLSVYICHTSIDRTCRFLQALTAGLKRHGIKIEISETYPFQSFMVIRDERIEFAIKEHMKQVPHVKTDKEKKDEERGWHWGIHKYDYVSKDDLRFRFTNAPWRFKGFYKEEFRNASKGRLEDQINAIIISAATIAGLKSEDRRRDAEEERLREEERKRQLEWQRQQAIKEARKKVLVEQASQWAQAEQVRQFISAMESKWIGKHGAIEPNSDAAKWIVWANQQADTIDPLMKSNPWEKEVKIDEWRYR